MDTWDQLFFIWVSTTFKVSQLHRTTKSNTSQNFSYGSPRRSRTAALPLRTVPVHVPGHHAWEPAHHAGCQLGQLPSHPCVVLPLQPVPGCRRPQLHHSPQDDGGHPDSKQRLLLCGLLNLGVSSKSFLGVWMLYTWLWWPMTGLWPPVTHCTYYPVIMNSCFCGFLVLVSFLISLLDSQLHNLIVLQLTCFKNVEISHFFCILNLPVLTPSPIA